MQPYQVVEMQTQSMDISSWRRVLLRKLQCIYKALHLLVGQVSHQAAIGGPAAHKKGGSAKGAALESGAAWAPRCQGRALACSTQMPGVLWAGGCLVLKLHTQGAKRAARADSLADKDKQLDCTAAVAKTQRHRSG